VDGRSAQEWVTALRDSSAKVRRDAVPALARLVIESPKAEAALAGALDDRDAAVRAAIVEAFGNAGSRAHFIAVAPLLRVLQNDPVDSVRARAAWALGRVSADEPDAVDDLANALGDASPPVRAAAALALAAIGSPAVHVAARIAPLLQDADSSVRRAGRVAIDKLRPSH
jgi:HEAT repeat protein